MFKDGRFDRIGQRGGVITQQSDPNRLQILAACAVIRMGWTDLERRARWQMSGWRQQSPQCPSDLRRLLSETG